MRQVWVRNFGGGLKASLFRTDTKLMIQWDLGELVQCHKFSHLDISQEEIETLIVDEAFLNRLMDRFDAMARDHFEYLLAQGKSENA
jgi:hypothetical protein